jgi:hypothetical protein
VVFDYVNAMELARQAFEEGRHYEVSKPLPTSWRRVIEEEARGLERREFWFGRREFLLSVVCLTAGLQIGIWGGTKYAAHHPPASVARCLEGVDGAHPAQQPDQSGHR